MLGCFLFFRAQLFYLYFLVWMYHTVQQYPLCLALLSLLLSSCLWISGWLALSSHSQLQKEHYGNWRKAVVWCNRYCNFWRLGCHRTFMQCVQITGLEASNWNTAESHSCCPSRQVLTASCEFAVTIHLIGKDVIGLAETGSGKTAAFAIPILQNLLENPQPFFACILAPTRFVAQLFADRASTSCKQSDVLQRVGPSNSFSLWSAWLFYWREVCCDLGRCRSVCLSAFRYFANFVSRYYAAVDSLGQKSAYFGGNTWKNWIPFGKHERILSSKFKVFGVYLSSSLSCCSLGLQSQFMLPWYCNCWELIWAT